MMSKETSEILLGIDYGETRIGLALGKAELISPLRVVDSKNIPQALNEIARDVIENKVQKLILGLPLSAEGKETEKSINIRKFGKLLKIRTKRPVVYVNEGYSTKDALEVALGTDISQKRRRSIDHLAAGIILKRYYEGLTI